MDKLAAEGYRQGLYNREIAAPMLATLRHESVRIKIFTIQPMQEIAGSSRNSVERSATRLCPLPGEGRGLMLLCARKGNAMLLAVSGRHLAFMILRDQPLRSFAAWAGLPFDRFNISVTRRSLRASRL